MSMEHPIVKMSKITKKFPGVTALSEVDFELKVGEIHGIMGENGAGKSTLIKVLTGVYQPENGQIFFDGKEIKPSSTLEAQKIGISTVYQEVNLCPNLSVAENIFIGREPKKNFKINWKEIISRSEKILKKFNLNIDVNKKLSFYSVAIQQMVAIARAIEISAKVLILDEPTASLDKDETQQLFSVMKKLKKQGVSIIFISHYIDNVYTITDRITVLRNGKFIDQKPTASFPKLEMISKMIGKELEVLESIKDKEFDRKDKNSEILLKARQLSSKSIAAFDLDIYKGEVIGLAGLLGSGRTEIAELLFGIDSAESGDLVIENNRLESISPKKAINNGISLCPEDRKTAGLIGDLSVRENMILALQVKRGILNFMSMEKQKRLCEKYIDLLDIATPSTEQKVKNLSGGNQQKVILARWLITNPKLLILDEPTRGIDIGTKTEIQKLVVSLAEKKTSVVFISSEIDEVIRVSNCVLVLRDRKKIAEIQNQSNMNKDNILNIIANGGEPYVS